MLSFLGFLKRPTYFFLALCMVLLSYTTARSQDCGEINQMEYGVNHWVGHAYQLNVGNIPSKDTDFFLHEYKGKLKDDLLSTDSMNFDLTFDDVFELYDDNKYLETTCDSIKLSYFGISFRSRYTVSERGVYEVTVKQDDGAALRVDGVRVHERWANFKYDQGASTGVYLFSFDAGQVVNFELNYFELNTTNRVTFSIRRYYGAGLIFNPERNLCAVDPNPEPFQSLGHAAFISELDPIYQWQYALAGAPNTWIDIPGATGEAYDMPRVSQTPFGFGKVFFRRTARTAADDPVPSNVIDITLTEAEAINQSEFGDLQWYGYVYDKYSNFDSLDYMGRLIYPKDVIHHRGEFDEWFGKPTPNGGREGNFTGAAHSTVDGATYSGCTFNRNTFSVRYKMKMLVTKGTYNFRLSGDDGFRMKIWDGTKYLVPRNAAGWAIDRWSNWDNQVVELSQDIEISENTVLYFTLEYTEGAGQNRIRFESFKDVFGILPVEWGQVSGNACGEYNCINWETIQEKNTSYFEVERSSDGFHWEGLGLTIPAAGYSTESLHYNLKDDGFTTKTTYYRIKQFDLDESVSYSGVIRIDNLQYGRVVPYPYPNPTKDRIRFYSKEAVLRTELISQDLKILINPKLIKVGEYLYEIDMKNLNNVHYMLTIIKESGEREVHKIIKK